ncbi:MAG: single-stranded-DNA-specific exonuclease RecJ [Candidatus Omnitrophica bacterium]|nr:single-stranded-DNA-specific exonuclease RecJ [Candidatus Omnitrophota bacterium]
MQKTWNILKIDTKKQQSFSKDLGISPILAQILLNRGIQTKDQARRYLYDDISKCFDPFLFKGMRKAIKRTQKAIAAKEKIFIYGDYDVDGLSSTALLYFVLRDLGADVECYIPHRVEEGYSLNKQACVNLKERKVQLIITVDCGISSHAEVKYLNSAGIDIIITDHHRIHAGKIPSAYAVINSMQKGCSYPYKDLAGVGIAYKFAQALTTGVMDISNHLDLVALGTICDVAPLIGENRILVKHGLDVLSDTGKIGLKALMEVTGISKKKITTQHVGFIIGPRINASGRMHSAHKALELFISTDYEHALRLAKDLDNYNKQRQKEEAKTLKQATSMIQSEINFKYHRSVVLHNDEWHPGVIGIVASRIAEKYYRPTILISTKDKVGKGSGRSIRNFHLFDTLSKCDHLLEGFGGHEKAAGISILKNNLMDFKEFFNDMVRKTLTGEELVPVIDVDMEVSLSALSQKLIEELELCAPFGRGNPRPVFASRDLKAKDRPKTLRGNSFKIWLTDGKVTCEALGSKFTDIDITDINSGFSVVYSPSINDWQGINTIQLKLKDLQFS